MSLTLARADSSGRLGAAPLSCSVLTSPSGREAWNAVGRREAAQVVAVQGGAQGPSDVEVERVLLDARRLMAEHSLYGVDINSLAVEMAKLSLWLITMDDERPFGFLDDRLLCGDSLLGLASWPQLRELHPDATVARRRAAAGLLDFAGGWRDELRDLHAEIDHAVMDAYGWDLNLGIGHHRTKIGTRWTVSPGGPLRLLDLLLEENHRRAGILPR